MQLFSELSPEARTLAAAACTHLAGGYDAASGLVTETMEGAPYRSVRNSMYYALALLLLDRPGAVPTAMHICDAVLGLQLVSPGEIWHGTFRHPDDPVPPRGLFPYTDVTPKSRYMADLAWERILSEFSRRLAENPETAGASHTAQALLEQSLRAVVPVAWDTYEPNLREFIGMTIAMLLEHFEDRFPRDFILRLEKAGHILMEGAISRVQANLTPLNTNIRIMYVFLLDWFGVRLHEDAWRQDAVREAEKLLGEYRELHACAEFNSPTYCGVDLSTLGFWRKYGSCETIRTLGTEMEEGIWRDMADFYNPDMLAFCGPYSRCYELDMSVHTCFYDLLYLGLGEKRFPFHPFSIESVINPLTVLGDIRIPEDVIPRLLTRRTETCLTRQFRELSERGDPDCNRALCTATAWITPDLMAGALSGSENPSYQLHPLVVFWKHGDSIGTIRLGRCLPDGTESHLHTVIFDGKAEPGSCSMQVHNRTTREVCIYFEIQFPGLVPGMISGKRWNLPGLSVDFLSGAGNAVTEQTGENTLRVTFQALPGSSQRFSLAFRRQ